jgi:hypothetical protein
MLTVPQKHYLHNDICPGSAVRVLEYGDRFAVSVVTALKAPAPSTTGTPCRQDPTGTSSVKSGTCYLPPPDP